MDIWAACRDAVAPAPLNGEMIRVVESQEQIATNQLVDNLDEQRLLEELLENSKPPAAADTAHLHYLLATPFRYPPLRHGSRFGSRHERGIFYASMTLATALAETAYYRFVFWNGMQEPPPSGKFTSEHSLFAAQYNTAHGLRLNEPPFLAYKDRLVNRTSYRDTQLLGDQLRRENVAAFTYWSARDMTDNGINIALLSPDAIASTLPHWQQPLLCETRSEQVSFYSKSEGTHLFPYENFLVNGAFPSPAI